MTSCRSAIWDGPELLVCELDEGHDGDHLNVDPVVARGDFTTMSCERRWESS